MLNHLRDDKVDATTRCVLSSPVIDKNDQDNINLFLFIHVHVKSMSVVVCRKVTRKKKIINYCEVHKHVFFSLLDN